MLFAAIYGARNSRCSRRSASRRGNRSQCIVEYRSKDIYPGTISSLFFAFDYLANYPEYEESIAAWIRAGSLDPLEDILEDIENMPAALIGLYEGLNSGVRMVRIDPGAN
jgi:hypothetical protein